MSEITNQFLAYFAPYAIPIIILGILSVIFNIKKRAIALSIYCLEDFAIIFFAIAQIIGLVAETASRFFFNPSSFRQVSA